MERAHWHSFQVLTKRPERMLEILSKPEFPTLPNVWLGTSVESEDYLERINLLRRVPARVRFISFEPWLGPIVGGESGPRARAMEAWWVEQLHEACGKQRIKFFFKQWGGKRKNQTGRVFKNRTWDDYPSIPV